jgi:ketosteroid isomerase-like protein
MNPDTSLDPATQVDPSDVAEAFSRHRFRETYDHLTPDIVWVAVGAASTTGSEEVIAVCENTLAELADTSTEFVRFLTVSDDRAVVVDSIGHYTDSLGATSAVASCDIYEFRDGLIARITSYTVEIDTATDAPG